MQHSSWLGMCGHRERHCLRIAVTLRMQEWSPLESDLALSAWGRASESGRWTTRLLLLMLLPCWSLFPNKALDSRQ
eukprot:663933-Amphidinium_carterae.1